MKESWNIRKGKFLKIGMQKNKHSSYLVAKEKENGEKRYKQKAKKTTDLSPNVARITLNVSFLRTPIKTEMC